MKTLFTLSFILFAAMISAQTRDYEIIVGPDHVADSIHVLLSERIGIYEGRARWHTLSEFAAIFQKYLITGGSGGTNWFTGDQVQTDHRTHDAGGYTTIINNQGGFEVHSNVSDFPLLLEHSTNNSPPIAKLLLYSNIASLNYDGGTVLSGIEASESVNFSNSNSAYNFGLGFYPPPDDNTLKNCLALDASGFLKQTDLSTIIPLDGGFGINIDSNIISLDTSVVRNIARSVIPDSIDVGSDLIIRTNGAAQLPRESINFLSSPTIYVVGTDDVSGNEIEIIGSVKDSAIGNQQLATGIDPAHLANGRISAAEFQRLNLVRSNIQQQLDTKAFIKRTASITSAATPSINTDELDYFRISAQAVNILSVNVSGDPIDGQILWIAITDNGSERSISWGTMFESSGLVSLPIKTTAFVRMDVRFMWNVVTGKWRCISKS